MTRAYIHTVLPSQAISVEDRGGSGRSSARSTRTGPPESAAAWGQAQRLVPLHVSLNAPHRNRVDTFDFEIVADDLFTPLLAYNAILNTLFTHSREVGAATYVVRGRVDLAVTHRPRSRKPSAAMP